ncbi:MAG: ABC transporter ATP-binding protein [Gemmatimonadetes bacterium]|nr:ABC transporter ATP-binding protein [Gemmatimonadota bacterium]MYA12267.1 ABC transporter ATP-binding protein [Gemmatimonadota bacterium]MYD13360.1 ABC transporter ATP-binding protein [Gemmatimonadota bacterium]MYE69923.1 ABC transporter ATP-binding protein [Gemmatimonadota bacterium]MYJ67995.1 ABC transporter ATP-binding protein [Gemmatimonadota bacterium]
MSEPQPAPVQLRELSIGYRRDHPVLDGLTVDVVPGEVLAIVGPNGSGKTTLFRTLLGVLDPLGGEASVAGLAPADYRRRHGLGYLAEDTAMPAGWSCDGVLALAAAAAGTDTDLNNALWLSGVDYDTAVPTDSLSKGMRRRLALAVALMRPTCLLILDEPESGLDPGQRIRLRKRIESIRGRMTILVASHDLGEMAMMSDRVFLIDRGQGRLVEQPEGGFTRDFLEKEFLGLEGAVS